MDAAERGQPATVAGQEPRARSGACRSEISGMARLGARLDTGAEPSRRAHQPAAGLARNRLANLAHQIAHRRQRLTGGVRLRGGESLAASKTTC